MADDLHKGADGQLFWFARNNRKEFTRAEQTLWQAVRNRNLDGYKFRRQHPINDFIADFYCHECKLIIELDGQYHLERSQAEYDEGRTFQLTEHGLTVIRFTNEEVIHDLQIVLSRVRIILAMIKAAQTLPSPLGEGPGMR